MHGTGMLLETIDRIYASVLDEDAERTWLDGVRGMVGAEHACLNSVGATVDWWSCSRFGDAERAIGDRFVQDPMYTASLEHLPAQAAVRLSQFLPIPTLRRSDMYQQLIRPMRGGIATAYTWRQDAHLNAITVCRSAEGDADFSDDELALLQPVLAHLCNAWRIRRRVQALEAACDRAHATLDAMEEGIAIVDASSRVLYLNPAAALLLQDKEAMQLVRRTLRAVKSGDDRRLQLLVRDAAGVSRVMAPEAARRAALPMHGAPGVIALRREPPKRPLLVSAAPARSMMHLHGGMAFADAVMLFLRDPDRLPAPAIEVLAEAFQLTRREAELALALQAGCSMTETAATLGISEGTARQYLKRVFAKTGVSRQSELVGLLRNLA